MDSCVHIAEFQFFLVSEIWLNTCILRPETEISQDNDAAQTEEPTYVDNFVKMVPHLHFKPFLVNSFVGFWLFVTELTILIRITVVHTH